MHQHCTVAMLFGGQSAEHDVSIQSAQNVHAALETAGYVTIPIGIDRQGAWRRRSAPSTRPGRP